jgi:hypothetical protein
VWYSTLVIPALRRLRQEDGKFQTSLGYITKSSPLPKKQKKFKKDKIS